jgi:hypothetical protein
MRFSTIPSMRRRGSWTEARPRRRGRKRPPALLAALLLGVVFLPALRAQGFPIPSFRARYSVSVDGIHAGTNRLVLQRTGPSLYVYKGTLKPGGVVALIFDRTYIQTSRFLFRHGHLVDLRYTLVETGGSHPTDQTIVFDWAKKQVRMNVGRKRRVLPLPPGTTDEQLAQLHVSYDLLAHARPHASYTVAEHNHVRRYLVHTGPERTFRTPLGPLKATEYYYFNKKGKKIAYWLAPDLYNLIVYMVVHTNAGLRVSMHLKRFTLLDNAVAPKTAKS